MIKLKAEGVAMESGRGGRSERIADSPLRPSGSPQWSPAAGAGVRSIDEPYWMAPVEPQWSPAAGPE
ncbi:hypothetical protein [Gandjariella thermophila]|uniref:hypothetical protein n=1 Tax=Gandjariella thermophila TaxID=1931992 RepID=UPI003FCE237A